jgi:sugar phosphate permease
MMGMAGSLAGAVFAQVLGYVIQNFGYNGAFALAALLHPCAATILFFLLRPVRKKTDELHAEFTR